MTASPLPTETITACPVCGGPLSAPFLQSPNDHYLGTLCLCRCTACDLVCLNPRLTRQSVEYVENESTIYDYSPEQRETIINHEFTPLVQWVPRFGRSTGRRWLDVGCNRGLLLEAARRHGWQVTGIEIAAEAAARARADYGLTVLPSFDQLDGQASFDVISAWHVLEHTFDPVGFLHAAKAHLAPGGVLAIQVPAYECLDEYRARNQVGGLVCAVHNFCFTADSLRQVIERSGLHIVLLELRTDLMLLTAFVSTTPLEAAPARPSWQDRARRLLRRGA